MKKIFLALWDYRHFQLNGHLQVDLSYFTDDNGYSKYDIEYLNDLEVNEIIQLNLGHYVMRIA